MSRRPFCALTLIALAAFAPIGCASPAVRVDPVSPNAAAAPAASVAAAARPAATADGDDEPAAPAGDVPEPVGVPVEGTNYVRGRATVKVKVPIERVRESILDFGHYAEFMPHYRNSRVLGRTPAGGREVYMEIEALYGALKFWAQIEFAKPVTIEGVETYDTKFVKGNVKEFKAIWRLRKLDDASTELSLEVFLQPSLPMPAGLMNDENLGGAVKGVVAMRARAEKPAVATAP